ncbi:MAG TPA: Crp/Fnr family transcriptional regulator [Pyrinomonadaceae bacterium]|jgi:CRP-like cAMP-binding protein
MTSSENPLVTFENQLLSALPEKEYERLRPHLELVRLPQGKILYDPGDTIRHVYFLMGGMVSLLSITVEGKMIEVGAIGNEGLVGTPALLGFTTSPYQTVVQLPCQAKRIKLDTLKGEFARGQQLQSLLLRFTHTLLTQVTQSVACISFHKVEARLCRWLLLSHDRVASDTFSLTQEFLSQMLGVPRTSVTMIAGKLQDQGLISYSRGKIQILNRTQLEEGSCECYRIVNEGMLQILAA